MPLVSVIIPTYQHAHFLNATIESVLNQTFTNFELIVVDDGSTDSTKDVCTAYGDKVIYIYQENSGQASARNTGIKKSKGEFISFLDSDDEWLPVKLEIEMDYLNKHPQVGLVYSNYNYFGSRKSTKRKGFDGYSFVSGHGLQAQKRIFLDGLIFLPSIVTVRKLCFDIIGIFDESLVPAEDLDMWLRIAGHFDLAHIDIPLANYRLHDKNVHLNRVRMQSSYVAAQNKFIDASIDLFDKQDKQLINRRYHRTYWGLGMAYLIDNGNPMQARAIFTEYKKSQKYHLLDYIWWLLSFSPLPFIRPLYKMQLFVYRSIVNVKHLFISPPAAG